MLRSIGFPELIVIGAIFFLLFGGKFLKNLATGLGESVKEFAKVKKEFHSAESDLKETINKS